MNVILIILITCFYTSLTWLFIQLKKTDVKKETRSKLSDQLSNVSLASGFIIIVLTTIKLIIG